MQVFDDINRHQPDTEVSTHLSMPSMMVSIISRLPSCKRRWTRFDYNHYLRKAEMPDRVGHDVKRTAGMTIKRTAG